MPLHVCVKPQRLCNRPGETVRAGIELTNLEEHKAIYVVEGISVRCHGLEICDPGWIAQKYYAGSSILRKDGRRVIRRLFSAHASQILERLVFLAPGQNKGFSIGCPLPEKLPPSFKGTSVRYMYEIQIGVKYRQAPCGEREALRRSFENQEPQSIVIKKPFFVFPNYLDATQLNNKAAEEGSIDDVPMLDVCFQSEDEVMLQWSEVSDDDKTSSTDGSLSKVVSDSIESSSTANMALRSGMSGSMTERGSVSRFSFAETEMSYHPQPVRRRNPSLTHAEAQMLMGTCVRPQMFNLRFGSETVVLFSFNPSVARPLRPGSTLGGVLRLSEMDRNGYDQKWRCLSYTVMLETEEEVAPEWQPETFKESRIIRRLHCEHTEFTGDVLTTNFMFSIPSSAPPSFKTPLLSLRWVLKFEFEVGRPMDWNDTGDVHQASYETEPLIWHLPLTVYPL